jgi:hypothetical protein
VLKNRALAQVLAEFSPKILVRWFVIALHSPDRVVETGLLVCPPEKKAAKLAGSNEQDTFSGPL